MNHEGGSPADGRFRHEAVAAELVVGGVVAAVRPAEREFEPDLGAEVDAPGDAGVAGVAASSSSASVPGYWSGPV